MAQFRTGRSPVTPGGDAGSGAGGDGESGGYSYMSYAGPIFPLTALGDTAGIIAERRTDFDFSPYETVQETHESNGESYNYDSYRTEAIVTDRYLLTNDLAEDRTLTLLYPVAASLNSRASLLPEITLDGAAVSPALHAGPYAGGFIDTQGKSGGERWNLDGAKDWEDYKTLLENGGYLSAALRDAPSLNQPVTVYKIDGYTVADTDAVNPTLQVSFRLDYDRTTVLTYGSNGGTNDAENGWCARDVGGLKRAWAIHPMYLILLGDDIDGYALQGYRNGGCEAGDEIEIGATVERYESTLETELRRIVNERLQSDSYGMLPLEGGSIGEHASSELVYQCLVDMLISYGTVSRDPAERYDTGMLEDLMGDSFGTTRVFYLAFDVTLPAGGSAEVSARMVKQASFDFFGTGTEKGYASNGYDLAAYLGSSLRFAAQYASLSNTDFVELIDNSFGFDPEHGVTEVRLDPGQEHYWIKLRKPEE